MYFGILVRAAVLALLSVLVAACQPQHRAEVPKTIERVEIKHAHADIYKLDSDNSWIRLNVYRDGPLARFGHNHVITIEQISGTLYREKILSQSEIELSFPVLAMAVDRTADRAEAGADFSATVAPEAIAGTRENMLGPKLLAAQQYPAISLRSLAISGAWPDLQMVIAVKLREFDSQIVLPAHVSEQDGILLAEGETHLSQVQLGLTPYSVLGGGLRVGDSIGVRFHLAMQRAPQK